MSGNLTPYLQRPNEDAFEGIVSKQIKCTFSLNLHICGCLLQMHLNECQILRSHSAQKLSSEYPLSFQQVSWQLAAPDQLLGGKLGGLDLSWEIKSKPIIYIYFTSRTATRVARLAAIKNRMNHQAEEVVTNNPKVDGAKTNIQIDRDINWVFKKAHHIKSSQR